MFWFGFPIECSGAYRVNTCFRDLEDKYAKVGLSGAYAPGRRARETLLDSEAEIDRLLGTGQLDRHYPLWHMPSNLTQSSLALVYLVHSLKDNAM